MASVYAIETIFPDGDMLVPSLIQSINALPTAQEVIVSERYKNRLDLVSYDYYGTTDLWWLIGLYNNIDDPTNMDEDIIKLMLPSITEITSLLNEYYKGIA